MSTDISVDITHSKQDPRIKDKLIGILLFESVMIRHFITNFFYWVVSMPDAVARLIITVLCAVALN